MNGAMLCHHERTARPISSDRGVATPAGVRLTSSRLDWTGDCRGAWRGARGGEQLAPPGPCRWARGAAVTPAAEREAPQIDRCAAAAPADTAQRRSRNTG